jgi:hypothetical protein
MAIDSVSSAGTPPVQQPSETRVASDAKRAADQAAQAEKAAAQRQAEQAQREQQAEQAQQSQPPKPVVNTQGQVTGQLLNEVA